MSRQVLDGKLITVNQHQFAFGPSHEGTRPGLNISIAPPLATPASGTFETSTDVLSTAALGQTGH
jgi:hypothetical protein